MNNLVTNKYASALLSIALEENKNEEYREYIKSLIKVIEENRDILTLLSDAFISKDEKKNVVDKVFVNSPSIYLNNFIKVIIDNGRARNLLEILKEFIKVSNSHDDIVEGLIYSVDKLSEKQIDELTLALEKKLSKKVYLRPKIDKDLIGGFKIVINDSVYDYSIKYKVDNLRNNLLGGN